MTTNEELEEQLSKIGKGIALVRKERIPDTKDIQEEADLEAERKIAHLANEWLLIDLRKKYGRNIIKFMWEGTALAPRTTVIQHFWSRRCVDAPERERGGESLPGARRTTTIS